ncbi:hypothetical protein ACS127_06420 [Amphibacillus sp. Q70]|uniref:hypothetical protein n=1 Tax=Amphibacillus sp. Q70 TaxID=3453416 RepID=UPI003F84BCB8
MNKKLIKILMLLAYCVPYVYLAMRGDYNSGTMMFYGLMIVCLGLLLWLAIKTKNVSVLIVGNVLTFSSSYFFILQNQKDDWWTYFKPFSPIGLLVSITIIILVIQALFIYYSKKISSNY